METIKIYLENMFMTLPRSKEVLRAKEELQNMMEDKYIELKNEGRTENEAVGIVISDFGNLNEVAEELGLSEALREAEIRPDRKVISVDTAKDFIENRITASYKVGIGVLLAIWSPIVLIILSTTENEEILGIYNGGLAIGLMILFSMVAVAVGLFIMSGVQFGRYDLDKNGEFILDYQTQSFVKTEEERNRMIMATKVTIGVVLCILSVVPLIIFGVLEVRENILIMGVGAMLLIVGVAVFLFITAGVKYSSFEILLKKGDYSDEARIKSRKAEVIGNVYWPIIVLIYLYWSFTTANWGFTWIIWPLAGLLFAAVVGIASLIDKNRNR
ncbi:permease prefix domain 1-containing protein [Proteiniclasticum sp.]|uniref:permease prefix domain 1-containing protein n=1 Tax=Proteiniclasticum sp. TaxID=2053595 RepID=UPI00289F6E7B|nr:permease prefix domain 1-containing protein [Proteiniclasticum sp.]